MTYRFHPTKPYKPIHELPEEITLVVTKEHCRLGRPGDPQNCALALSAREGFRRGELVQVEVLTNVAYFEFKSVVYHARNQANTAEMIRQFDRDGQNFEPGEYTFLPPSPSWTRAGKRKLNKKHGRKTTGAHPESGRRQKALTIVMPRGQEQVVT